MTEPFDPQPTRGYLRRTRDHECGAHLKRSTGSHLYECRVCGSIHAPQFWREERGGVS